MKSWSSDLENNIKHIEKKCRQCCPGFRPEVRSSPASPKIFVRDFVDNKPSRSTNQQYRQRRPDQDAISAANLRKRKPLQQDEPGGTEQNRPGVHGIFQEHRGQWP